MTATFTKLRSGAWGLRVVGEKPKAGQSVPVTKKDGGAEAKVVGDVIWSQGDVHICAMADGAGERKCRECGVKESSLRKPYEKILRNGLCTGCWSDIRDGYGD